ncbi:T9SS type A sorting domain-containing protein [Phaeodactylibacter luteus]|uniref:T9SS type A sorting domain-containing protein n=1 Tax=Phaeodactylibacter luteus TaxID=1564516 RepID=A0A5C6RMM1_9BACT|nr:T9SS type A sorting domain-containing protein [Phaeodactylibacter luteus]TXB63453.1 T9SS type A sorting domain-containing protein [Phaeodactylibacter luteus]
MYLLQTLSYARTTGKLLLLFLLLTLGARQGFAQYGGGNGTSGSPYLISTAAHLVSLSQDPNDWALHFRQTANINLNGVSLNDIDFSGVYDGDNFTISNYTITGTSNDKGLFSELVGSATVQDLTLNNFNISGGVRVGGLAGKASGGTTIDNVDATGVSIDGNFDSGGLIGECGGCTIQNSTVDATSMIDCGNTGGGIVGKSVSSATYTNLSSSAQMTGSSLGGIVGNIFNNPTFTNCSSAATISNSSDRLGGIAGKCTDTPSFSGCSFSGSISGTWHCGGIIGRVEGGTATITNCNNSGSITQTADEGGGIIGTTDGTANVSTSYNTGSINANWKSAGIIGRVNSNSTVTITECYNSGTITSNANQAGGIVGTSTGVSNIIESYNTGSITSSANSGGIIGRVETPASGHSSLTDCYNTGAIDGGWSAGIIGEETDGGATTVVNCYNAGTVDNDSSVGDLVSKGGSATVTATNCFYDEQVNTAFTSQTITGITGKTTAEMKDYTTFTAAGWDFVSETTNGTANIWDADQLGTVNNGYMILRWQAGADDDLIYTYSGGAGTQGDPYQIATAADLIALSGISEDWDKHFRQTANIDFGADETAVDWDNDGSPDGASPAGFSPIGNFATEFTGSYDGDGKTISNLFINRSGSFYLGLFGRVSLSGGGISDLGLLNADITGNSFVGAIVGFIASSSTGSVSGCYSTGSVVGSNNQIGGLVGSVGNSPTSRIENCYSRCSVNGGSRVGGLVGVIEAVNTTTAISNCYSTGAVTGTGDDVGGLVGANINGGITTDSFWDTQTSGQATSAGGTGKTTAEMKTTSTFSVAGWGNSVWYMDPGTNDGYPNLQGNGTQIPLPSPYNDGAGAGTEMDPHQIASVEDLIYLSQTSADWGLHFIQVADIDFGADETAVDWDNDGNPDGASPAGFSPIGNSTEFTGSYDGDGKTISNLFINRPASGNVGLFGQVSPSGRGISDLGLINVNITGDFRVGALAGWLKGGNASGCYSTGSVEGTQNSVGGLVGATSNTTITAISNCYSTCSVTGSTECGGLVGVNNIETTISNCYSTGTVTASGGTPVVGGLVGDNNFDIGTITNSFWDTQTSGQATSAGGTGKTTAEMQSYATFQSAGWDFVSETANGTADVWDMDQEGTVNNSYPILSWQPGADLRTQKYGGGNGTSGSPYEIHTATHLIELSNNSGDWDKHFIQTANIDFGADETAVDWDNDGNPDGASPAGFSPIGNSSTTKFTGSYDGNEKTISNLFINRAVVNGIALFGYTELSGVGISDLGLLNADITGFAFVGAIVGDLSPDATAGVSGCYSTGSVDGASSIGGVVGSAGSSFGTGSIIENCYSRCSVNGSTRLGGLVGTLYIGYTISNCYSTGAVTVTGIGDNVGGLLGLSFGGTITNSFWDTQTSGQATSAGGTGKTTAEMKTATTFTDAGWSTPWYLDATENNGYPNLSGVGPPLASYGTDLTIVSTGGGTQDTDWAVNGGMLYGVSGGAVSVNASDLNNQLSTGDLELFGNGLTVSENIAPGSGTHTLTLGFSNGVTVSAGKGIDLGGSLVNNSPLTLTSTSTSYSSLKVLGTITGTGSISYERYTNEVGMGSSGGNDLVGTPFTGQPFGPFAAANTNLAASGSLRAFGPWDNTGTGFINYDVTANAGTTLTPGTGYRAATTDGSPVIFTGTVQTGNVTVNITDAASQWNAVANPYPAYLSMADFLNYDHGGGVTNQSLMVESAAGIYGYDGNSTDGWTVITLANASTSLMAPGQGFFVAADAADIDAYDLTFTPTMMRTGDSDDFISGFAPVQTPVYFKLQAFTDSRSYGTSIYFNEASATGLDVGYDAVLWGDAIPDFAVYTHLVSEDEGEPFALQSLGLSDLDDPELAIPLGLEAAAGIPLTLAITEEELPAGIEVYLLDSLNGERTLLSGLPYTFTPNAALSGAGRYYLVFNEGQVVSTSSETDGGDLSALVIYAPQYREELVITGELPGAAQLSLFDVQGRKLLGRALSAGTTQQTVATGNLPGGIYLVRIESPQGVRAEQLFIP